MFFIFPLRALTGVCFYPIDFCALKVLPYLWIITTPNTKLRT